MTPKKLLRALAPEDPINDDERGGCVWCMGVPRRGMYSTRDIADHRPGCPWVKARRLLGDTLPDSRKTPNARRAAAPAA